MYKRQVITASKPKFCRRRAGYAERCPSGSGGGAPKPIGEIRQGAASPVSYTHLVQKAISTLTVGKTLIVIAHRLSTIVGADNIVVMKDGTIHAQGTHEKLLEACPLYRDMWQAHIGAKDQM